MDNFLSNGAILPHGLLTHSANEAMAGFNKTYRNYPLRMGIVIASYAKNDPNNSSKLTTEYDVMVFEQYEDKGSTTITYKNCLSSEGLGSIADYFEKNLRVKTSTFTDGGLTNTTGQDGAIALLLCLDAMSSKAIIISSIIHPDRPTTLTGVGPMLGGEYNGVNVIVNNDGSCSLTFKGATTNYGIPIDSTQGNTVISIETDGSYQVMHGTITQRLDKNGKYTLTTQSDITNNTQTNFNINAKQNIVANAVQNITTNSVNLLFQASGTATFACQQMIGTSTGTIGFSGTSFQLTTEAAARINAPAITLTGQVALGGAGGQPILLLGTIMLGIDSLGGNVYSHAISGYSTMVTAI